MGNRPPQPLTGVLPSGASAAARVQAPDAKALASARLAPPTHVAQAADAREVDALCVPALAPAQQDPHVNDATRMQIVPPAHALARGAATPRSASQVDSTDDLFAVPESVRKSQTLDAFASVCSEILPQFLYVSNLHVASDAQALQALGITHVVDCCSELTCASPHDARIERLALALRDGVQEDLLWFVYRVIAFIERVRCASSASRVLVHCHQGVSRSCGLAVMYVMFQQQQQGSVSFRDALALVKAKRPIASPNTAFLCQLIEWERELATFALTPASSPVNTLYRLAPHAPHDAATLVLKRCYAPEAATTRTAVVMALTSSGGSDSGASTPPRQQQWLYARGIFVFLQQTPSVALVSTSEASASDATYRVVVWCGRECVIPDGVATAKTLVAEMAHVRGAAQTLGADSLDIVEVVDGDGDNRDGAYTGTLVDHFGYAAELEWLTNASVLATPLSTSQSSTVADANDDDMSACEDDKPQLFVFEGFNGDTESWDHLTNYDADDITPDDACLLLQPASSRHFLWFGSACSVDRAALLQCATSYVRVVKTQGGAASGSNDTASDDCDIEIVESGDESDVFWTAFERGY